MEHKKYIGITHFALHYVMSVCLSLKQSMIDGTINKWQILRENTSDKQRRYLLDAGFEDVDVHYDNKTKKLNVEAGDHLFYQGKGLFYDHHLLCIAIEDDTVHCIEYGKSKMSLSKALSMLSSATFNPLLLGKLQKGKITFQELINKKVLG